MDANTGYRFNVLEYHFDNSLAGVKTSIGGNLFLFSIFLMGGLNSACSSNALVSIFSGISLLLIYFIYDWRKLKWNIVIALLYVLCTVFEFVVFGMPESLISFDGTMHKGVILDGFFMMLPVVYLFMRILLLAPLIYVIYTSIRVQRVG